MKGLVSLKGFVSRGDDIAFCPASRAQIQSEKKQPRIEGERRRPTSRPTRRGRRRRRRCRRAGVASLAEERRRRRRRRRRPKRGEKAKKGPFAIQMRRRRRRSPRRLVDRAVFLFSLIRCRRPTTSGKKWETTTKKKKTLRKDYFISFILFLSLEMS